MHFAARMQFVLIGSDMIFALKDLGIPLPTKLQKVKAKYIIFFSCCLRTSWSCFVTFHYCKLNTCLELVCMYTVQSLKLDVSES